MSQGTWGGLTDPNIFQVRVGFIIGGSKCQTGFHLRDKLVQDNSPSDVEAPVKTWVDTYFKPLLLTVDQLDFIDILKMGSDEGFTFTYVGVNGTSNPNATTREPSFLCANVALKSQHRARYGQGRMFWPVRGGELKQDNVLSAGGIAALQGAIDGLTAAFSASNVLNDLGLVNVHHGIAARAASPGHAARAAIPPSWYDVDTVRLNTTLTALKTRRAGIGA